MLNVYIARDQTPPPPRPQTEPPRKPSHIEKGTKSCSVM